jgi:hypothetical protein
VAVAVAGVYQGYVDLRSGGEPSVLALLAPGLVGLGAALFVARALPFLAGKVGAAALRTGRPGATLTALHLARRPGTHRVFAVLAVSVSVFTTAIFFWHTANLAWGDRAAQELGAQRVLTVQAPNSTMLLAAVRAADPSGEHAMAVARGTGVRVESRILAVDSTRFAAVAEIPTGGGTATDIARLLRPAAQSAPVVQAGALTLDAAGPPQPETDRPVRLRVHLAAGDGTETTVDFGPLTAARATYQATVTGCPGGCRLVSFEPVLNLQDAIPAATQVSLYSLAQSGREVVSGAMFSDITRWRTQVGSVGLGEVVSARDGRLALAPFIRPLPQSQRRDLRVFSVDTPVPLPVVLAGARPVPVRAGDERITVLGTERVAFQVVGRAAVLPRLGDIGGVVDLEYAQRMVTNGTENAVLEVWLTADAPAEVLDRLRGAGVRILTEDSMPVTADRYAQQGPGLALEFELFAAGIVLLLAAGTIVVTATVERRSRVEELMAMRVQGLSERAMRVAGHGGTGVLVASAVLTGLSAAVAGQAMVAASMPIFADGWALLPMRLGPRPTSLTVAFLGAATVLGVAATLGSARVVAAVTARRTGQQP